MDLDEHIKFYRKSIDKALKVDFDMMKEWESELDDDTKCLVILRSTLRRLANEAEARINIKAQTNSLIGS